MATTNIATDANSLVFPAGTPLAIKKSIREFWTNYIPYYRSQREGTITAKMQMDVDIDSLVKLKDIPAKSTSNEGTNALDFALIMWKESSRLRNFYEYIVDELVKDPDCKELFLSFNAVVFKTVQSESAPITDDAWGYSYELADGNKTLVVVAERDFTKFDQWYSGGNIPPTDAEVKKLMTLFDSM